MELLAQHGIIGISAAKEEDVAQHVGLTGYAAEEERMTEMDAMEIMDVMASIVVPVITCLTAGMLAEDEVASAPNVVQANHAVEKDMVETHLLVTSDMWVVMATIAV